MPDLQDKLIGALIGLVRASEGNEDLMTPSAYKAILDGLACSDGDGERLTALISQVREEKRRLVPNCFSCAAPCGRTNDYDMQELRNAPEEVRRLKVLILFCIKGMAAHMKSDGADKEVNDFFCKALYAVGADWGADKLTSVALEAGELGLRFIPPTVS